MADTTANISLYSLQQEIVANAYTHPSTHPAEIIVTNPMNRFVTDTQITGWNAKANNNPVTTVTNGIMLYTDKVKLDTIDRNAEVNQLAYGTLLIDGTTLPAKLKNDIIKLNSGTNIDINADKVTSNITISVIGDVASAISAQTLGGKSSDQFADVNHTHYSASLPSGVDISNDNPGLWPDSGITQYAIASDSLLNQPGNFGLLSHFSGSGSKYQIWHNQSNENNNVFHRSANEGRVTWCAWTKIAMFSDIPTTLPANGGDAATVGGIDPKTITIKTGDILSGNFNMTDSNLNWSRDISKFNLNMQNYGHNIDIPTFKFGSDPSINKLKFVWDNADQTNQSDIFQLGADSIDAFKPINVNGSIVATLDSNGKIPESMLPDRALSGDGGVPIGTIIAWTNIHIPNGWVECNGQFLGRTEFAELFSKIGITFNPADGINTFGVPDLRGEFIRGWDNTRGINPDRTFGSFEADDIKAHNHQIWGDVRNNFDGTGRIPSVAQAGLESWCYTENTGNSETRPRNIALIYIIKAKNIIGTDPLVKDANANTLGGFMASAFAMSNHTSHIGETSLLQGTGYKKFSDGFMIQWGTRTVVPTSVNFPIPFTNMCVSVTPTFQAAQPLNAPVVTDITKDGFIPGNYVSFNLKYNWIAFGF